MQEPRSEIVVLNDVISSWKKPPSMQFDHLQEIIINLEIHSLLDVSLLNYIIRRARNLTTIYINSKEKDKAEVAELKRKLVKKLEHIATDVRIAYN